MPLVASREDAKDLQEELIVIRTSDRLTFKKCRRLWGWMSHLKMGLQMQEEADYFWFGTGVHYALEDYHSHNVFGHPAKAFTAYAIATGKRGTAPPNASDLLPLGQAMMSYYADYWLRIREPHDTWWIDGKPQVEVNGYIDLNMMHKGKRVVYGFTIDRMIIDKDQQVWVGEYKTAKTFRQFHYDTDEQCTAYCWTSSQLYRRHIAGVMYIQFKKQLPQLPRILSTGKISTDPKQPTSSALYRRQLMDVYGDLKMAPIANIKCLNEITDKETYDGDRFVIRDKIDRTVNQVANFPRRVMLELEDILNDNLPLYPNQSKDCSWSCPLQSACLALEDGADYEDALSSYARHPNKVDKRWRGFLPLPEDIHVPPEMSLYGAVSDLAPHLKDGESEDLTMSPEEAFFQEIGG